MNNEADLQAVLNGATQFLSVVDVEPIVWCRRPRDGRHGPWNHRAIYNVDRPEIWKRRGEVLYFISDEGGRLRHVGQSTRRLKDRWRPSPMFDCSTGQSLGSHALFHSSAWPAIEDGLARGERPPFIVSAIFREELEVICRDSSGPLGVAAQQPESHLHRLSWHVEQWICSMSNSGLQLWNVQGAQ